MVKKILPVYSGTTEYPSQYIILQQKFTSNMKWILAGVEKKTCLSFTKWYSTWFPQTLKSAWIWMLSWKMLDFSICLENGKFSLKSAWKWLYGLEKYKHQKV